MNRIGITGYNSFLGRHLVTRLKNENKTVVIFTGDILNPAEVSGFVNDCDTIYHLAGYNRGKDKDVYEINMIGGANVTAAAVSFGNRHIIFPSSKYLLRYPDSPYSFSKMAVENMLRKIAGINNCRTNVFRLSNVYGSLALPFHVSVVATFSWFEANGLGNLMPVSGDGSQKVELVHIAKVIDLFLNATMHPNPLSLLEVSGQEFSIRELSAIIHDPELRKAYPGLDETVNFFKNPVNLKVLPENATDLDENNILILKLMHNNIVMLNPYEVLTLQPGYHRQLYMSFEDNSWIYLVNGSAALDIFLQNEEYLNTILINGISIKCVEMNSEYRYKIRNLTMDPISVRYYR